MKRFLYTFVLTLFFWFSAFSYPGLVRANDDPPTLDGLWVIVANAFNLFFSLIGIVAAAMFVYGAYMWMFSMGNPENIKKAQGTLTWAVIGLVFYAIMRLLLVTILDVLGIDELPGVQI